MPRFATPTLEPAPPVMLLRSPAGVSCVVSVVPPVVPSWIGTEDVMPGTIGFHSMLPSAPITPQTAYTVAL